MMPFQKIKAVLSLLCAAAPAMFLSALSLGASASFAGAAAFGGSAPTDPEDAEIQKCREQVRDFPDEAFAHNNLALALFHAKQDDEALQEVRKALSLDPNSAEAHTTLGLILSAGTQEDAAVREFKQALALDPDNGVIHNNLGVVYFNREQWTRAEYEFRKALQDDHGDAYAHHNLADTLLREGRLQDSIDECGKTLRYAPAFASAFGTRGLVEDKLGRTAAGQVDLAKDIALAPDPSQALLDLSASLKEFAGSKVAAQQFAERRRHYPLRADTEETLSRLQMSAGQDGDAALTLAAAIRLQPKRASSHLLLARVLLRLDRPSEAASEARAALDLEPTSGLARNLLGLALYPQGQKAEARQQWTDALQQDDKDAARNAAGFLQEFP